MRVPPPPPPTPFYGVNPTGCSSSLRPNSLSASSFFPFTSIFSVHSHFTLVFFLSFPFLYYLPIYSHFPSFPSFSLFPFLPFLYHSYTSPPVLLYFSLVPRDYTPSPPLNFSVTELFVVLISFLP
jgi:hypothetical protein